MAMRSYGRRSRNLLDYMRVYTISNESKRYGQDILHVHPRRQEDTHQKDQFLQVT